MAGSIPKGTEDAKQAGKNGMPLAGPTRKGPKKHSSRKSSRK
jgi:hypothetical protein